MLSTDLADWMAHHNELDAMASLEGHSWSWDSGLSEKPVSLPKQQLPDLSPKVTVGSDTLEKMAG